MRIRIGKNVAYKQYACATIRRVYKNTVTLQVWWRAGDMVEPEFRLIRHVAKKDLVPAGHLQPEFAGISLFYGGVTVYPDHP